MNLRQADAWLRLSAERLHDQATTLTQLDQAIGDGDHGINMDRGFTAIVAMLDAQATPNGDSSGQAVGGLLRQAGQTLIRTVGGASGPLYGTALLRAAAVYARAEQPSVADTVAAMKAAADGVGSLGRSTTGEKTMLDALTPAIAAMKEAEQQHISMAQLLRRGSDAAEKGMKATILLRATKGRASYLGERSIGHQDPGATSSWLMLKALADTCA